MTVIYDLDTPEHMDHARALLSLVFGGVPRIRPRHRLYGIYNYGELVAVTGINVGPFDHWFGRTAYARRLGKQPEAAISFTAVHLEHRQRGHAKALRRHVMGLYSSLVTGTGPHSNRDAMHRLNQQTGFRVVWQRGKSTCWYWERAQV